MNKELIGGVTGTVLSATGTALQPNEVLQTISLVITIVGGLITLIIIPLYNWWHKAKKDGKIDKDEIDEAIGIIQDGTEEIKKDIDENKKKGE